MKIRSLLAVAVLVPAAALAAPKKELVAAKPASSSSSAAANPMAELQVGGFLGYETDDVSGVALRADGEIPFRKLAPQVNLSWVGSLGFSHLTKSESAFGVSADFTANILKIIPAARFTFPLNPQFSLFGDAGLGLYYVSTTSETSVPGFGSSSISDSEFSIMMRIGGGAFYQLNPKTRIGASIEFDPYLGDFDQTTFIIQAGAMFRM